MDTIIIKLTFSSNRIIVLSMEFTVGDVVYLKNNPERLMTVYMVCGFSESHENEFYELGFGIGDVQCIWFAGNTIKGNIFRPNMLKLKSRSATSPVLNPGDIVCLKSNPETILTVSFVAGSPENPFSEADSVIDIPDGDVQCKWEYGSSFKFIFLYAAMLEKKKTNPFSVNKIIQFPSSLHKKR